MLKVSVLMTVYNGQEHIRYAIESVLKQSYPDFEFIIVDDASDDASLEIIKAYRDKRIRLIRNASNQGQTRSLNIGLAASGGEYIARIDADDIAFSNWLQSQVNFLENRGGVDVLSAGLVTFDEKGLSKAYFPPSCRQDILLKAIIKSPVNHGGAFMKKDTILRIGGYNNDYKIAADYGLWIKLLMENGLLTSNPDIVMAIRRRADSQSEQNKLAQALKESSVIFRGYVRFLTGLDLTEEDSLLILRAHYDEAALNRENFLRAVDIHKNVYASLRKDLDLNKGKAKFWRRSQVRTFFLKRIHRYILHSDRLEARAVAKECLRIMGFRPVFAGLFILSFFPQPSLGLILKAYYFNSALITKLHLGKQKKYLRLKELMI